MSPDPSQPPRIMILAGEPSGDVHGSHLIRAILRDEPCAQIFGIGGPNMEAAGMDVFFPIEKLSAMGLVEVLGQFKQIRQAFTRFKENLARLDPHLIILIDYPGFNLKAAAFAKAHSKARVMYYITPKVWAWNQRRLKRIKAHVDHAALIFPFEAPLYKRHGIPATFVGNPLMDQYPHLPMPLPPRGEKPLTIGILPGSRRAEIENLLPVLLAAACEIQGRVSNVEFLVSSAQSVTGDLGKKFSTILDDHGAGGKFTVIKGDPRGIFNQSHLLMAASGTVTLEAALCQVPTILVYKMAPVTYRLARLLVKVEYAGLANLVAKAPVMPELLQDDANPGKICETAMEMLKDLSFHREKLSLVRKRLGGTGASVRAARIALNLAHGSKDV